MEFELFMVRHGETESNRTHIIQGHLDTPLSNTGLSQAKLVATYLAETEFTLAISSDLARALTTGQSIRDANSSFDDIEVWRVARERCFGKLEGQGVDNMLQEVKGKNKDQIFAWGPEGGETGSQFRDRVRQFVKDLGKRVIKCKENESPTPTRVLVTTHGGFIKDFNMVMVNEYNCSMPCKDGEWGRICPNTGVSTYNMVLDEEGELQQKVVCTKLHYKGHLEGAEYNEPVLYGV